MSDLNYDIAVAYRIYPKVSKVPLVFKNDKYKLSEVCLKSFKESLGDLKVKMLVLLDNCPPEYKELFQRYFSSDDLEFIELKGVGNLATFDMQVRVLLEQNYSNFVYFAEDDYFYLPKQFGNMLFLLKTNQNVDFVSPYDHLDYYTLDLHNHSNFIKICNNIHWRTANSTCLTFLTTKSTLEETKNVFKSYNQGNFDASIWLSLTKYKLFNFLTMFRYWRTNVLLFAIIKNSWRHCWKQILFGKKCKLWIPIPSIATHLDSDYLAPAINWSDIISQEIYRERLD